MTKFLLLSLLVVGLTVRGSQSLSVVNNVTLSSEALSELFFEAIRSNDLLESSQRDAQQDLKCFLSLQAMVTQFPSLKVLPFFDAWGKFPSGILYGSFYDVGNFDQCVKHSATLSSLTGLVSGQFCFASVPLFNQDALLMPDLKNAPIREARAGLADYIKISIGICVPDSCTADTLTRIFRTAVASVPNGALLGVSVAQCTNGKRPEFDTLDIVGITIFSTFAGLMVISTIYDFLMAHFERKPVPVLLAFSMLTNGRKLFAINTKKSPNTISCLTGIRVFSMIWVMYGHTYGIMPVVPIINTIEVLQWFKAPWSMHVINATVSVDSFFFISGVLVAWLGFKELDRRNGKLNVVMMYVHRYIRLTPAMAAGILFIFTVYRFIAMGPFKAAMLDLDTCDGYNWWPVLLYIQNYYVQETPCYPQTWYLAIDFQLYVLSPLLLIPMWKWGKKFVPVLVILILLSIGCVMGTYITEGYTDLKGMMNDGEWEKVYTPMHTRYSPWIIGFGLGYFMYINRNRVFRPSKILQLAGWTVSFVIIVSILFGPYFTLHNRGSATVFEATMYEGLKRVSWAIALAWITFACQFGFGGVVDGFLSHPFWQPLARLTYSLYLVHLAILGINFSLVRAPVYFSDYQAILYFWSTFGISLVMAIAMVLAFESPVLVLEKAIFGRGKTKEKEPTIEPSLPPTKVAVF